MHGNPDLPTIPLTMGERDAFARLTAEKRRCRYCRNAATGRCGCCCPEHDTVPAEELADLRAGWGLVAATTVLGLLIVATSWFWSNHQIVSTPDGPAVVSIQDGPR